MPKAAEQTDRTTLRFTSVQVRLARAAQESESVPLSGELNVLLYGTARAPVREEWRRCRCSESEEYWVSDLGHLAVWRERPARIWKRGDYLQAVVYVDGRKRPRALHVLVARMFCTWKPGDRVVRHLNGDRRDNYASNLMPGSQGENMQDRLNAARGVIVKTSPAAVEVWKLSDEYAGARISSHGRVKLGWWVVFNTAGYSYKRGKNKGKKKHVSVKVTLNKTVRYELLHRLEYEAFVGAIPARGIIRHLNDDPHDNRLVNLALGTGRENSADRVRNGHQPLGQTHANAKYSDKQRGAFIALVADGMSQAEAARRARIKPSTGYQIINRLRNGLPVAFTFTGEA